MNRRWISAAVVVLVMGVAGVAQAQPTPATPGGLPWYLQVVPQPAQAGFTEMRKALLGPKNAIPAKEEALIGLAVSAQIPCEYCVYSLAASARKAGASEEEIQQAVAIAGFVRLVSAVENGNQVDFAKFKASVDGSK